MLIFYKDFQEGLNIFTDASMNNDSTIGCPGYVCVSHGTIIEQDMTVLYNTSVNNAELYGILMGVYAAQKHRDRYNTIRIFSDSQLSIFALRDRIFKWVRNPETGESKLVGANNQVIKNQNMIMEIIYTILYFDIKIELYHQKGHVNPVNKKEMQKASSTYCASNGTNYVDPDLITTISFYNSYVDNITRQFLKINVGEDLLLTDGLVYPYFPFDINKYQSLINKKGE